MRRIIPALRYFFTKADMLLLFLCVSTTALGTVIISIMLGTMVGVYSRAWGKKLQAIFEADRSRRRGK